MKNKTLKNIILAVATLIGSLSLTSAVYADPLAPADIFSTVETGSVEITLKNALYPVTGTSTRTWTVNDIPVVIDNLNFADGSKGQDGILKIANITTDFHLAEVKVTDTTVPAPSISIDSDQYASIYVFSKERINGAALELKPVTNRVVGDTLEASSLTLYIDGYPCPNFQTLKFVKDGAIQGNVIASNGLMDSITVPETSKTYTVIETVTGKLLTCKVEGWVDKKAPVITKLLIRDSLENKYAIRKDIEVEAEDDDALPLNPYYWEKDPSFALFLKEEISEGKKSEDLKGLSWTDEDTYTVTANGKYTVFVRDRSGNIAYKDIEVNKISLSVPTIYYMELGKNDDDVYIDVNAYDDDNQPLSYKLNKGKWQTSSKLYGVAEGKNTVYVRNEAGIEVSAVKEVYLNLYKNKVGELSAESLCNYITPSPSTWTNKSVTLTLKIPDSIKKYLSSTPYSINGEKFTTNNNYTSTEQGEVVQFSVQDIYGKIYTSNNYVVSNIDKDAPSIMAVEDNGTITVSGQDTLSGVIQISVSGMGASHYAIKANGTGVAYDSVVYKAPANGSYQFMVTDAAGNTASSTISVNCYAKNTVQDNYTKSGKTTTIKAGNGNTAGSKGNSSSAKDNGKSMVTDEEDGETVETVTSSDSSGSYTSNAGHSEPRESKTAELITVSNKKGESSGTKEPVKIDTIKSDETNMNTLKKLIWIVPVIILGSVVVVVIINKKK